MSVAARFRSLSRVAGVIALVALPGNRVIAESSASRPGEAHGGLVDLDGRPRAFTEFRGSILVVNFWATWCVPCRHEMPLFVDLAGRRGGAGVVVIGASADSREQAKAVRRFMNEMRIGFPIWLGATTEDMARLGLGSALPATAVLDRDGRVVLRVDGVVDGPGLDAWIEWLLGDRAAPAPRVPIDTDAAPPEEGRDEHGHDDHDHRHGPGVGLDGPSLVPS